MKKKEQYIKTFRPSINGEEFSYLPIAKWSRKYEIKAGEAANLSFYNIFFFLEVTGDVKIDNKTFQLQHSTILCTNAEQYLNFDRGSFNSNATVISFSANYLAASSITDEFIASLSLFQDCKAVNYLFALSSMVTTSLSFLLQTLEYEINNIQAYRGQRIASLLQLVLIELYRNRTEVITATQTTKLPQLVKKFKELVEQHYKTMHDVAWYAAMLNLSAGYLYEVIRKELKQSPKKYILNRVMQEAKRMALHTELSMKEIAFENGFEDISHFSKYFKQVHGVGFAALRKKPFA